jgi:outer membrane protein
MKVNILLLVVVFLLSGVSRPQTIETKKNVKIGIVVDGEWDLNQPILENLEKELKDALSQQANVSLPRNKILIGDWTLKKVHAMNDQLLNDNEVDIIIGYGVLASFDLAHRETLPKPVIAPVIIDTAVQRVKSINGTSGKKNLSYLIFPGTYVRDIKLFKEIVDFKNLIILQSKYYQEEFKDIQISDKDLSEQFGVNIKRVSISDNVDEFLKSIPEKTDAVYLDVLPISRAEFKKLVQGLNEKRIPTFSFFGENDVKDGVMAAANPDIFPRLARRIALNVQRILLGEEAGSMNVYFSPAKRIFINLKTAFSVGVSPKWSTLLEADIINMDSTDVKDANTYSLTDVIKMIGNENLDVLAKYKEVTAFYQNIPIARSYLFPSIDLSLTGLKIDPDRALAGSQPENRIYGDASFSQIIFSESTLANLSIQSSLYDSKASEYEALKQTTILEGSKLFLNYLRTRKIFNILLDNLKLLRFNLEIAKNREAIGAAGPEEPLRWEAAVAGVSNAVMDFQAQMNQVQLALKQILNIPLVYIINFKDISLENDTLLINNKKFQRLLEDPMSYELSVDFLVSYGMKQSVDLRVLNSIIEAKERGLSSIQSSRFLPTISAFGTISNTFYKSKINSPFSLAIPTPPPGLSPEITSYIGQIFSGFKIPLPNDIDWNIGINFSLNLFNGLGTSAKIEQSEVELDQLKIQKQSIEDKVALGIRSEMESLKARFFGFKQSLKQVEAANKTLKIVLDSYSRGAVSILYLLDAQSAALNSQQLSANALYEMYISYMQLQRVIGKFDALMTNEERTEFMNALLRFLSNAGWQYK